MSRLMKKKKSARDKAPTRKKGGKRRMGGKVDDSSVDDSDDDNEDDGGVDEAEDEVMGVETLRGRNAQKEEARGARRSRAERLEQVVDVQRSESLSESEDTLSISRRMANLSITEVSESDALASSSDSSSASCGTYDEYGGDGADSDPFITAIAFEMFDERQVSDA